MQCDFHNEGIHLPPNKQEIMKAWQGIVVQQETLWSQNIANGSEIKQILDIGPYPADQHDHFVALSKWCGQYTKQTKAYDRMLSVPIDRRLLTPLLKSLGTSELRKSLWFESYVQPLSNISALHGLIHSRQALAQSLQMPTYLQRAIAKHVNPQPEQIRNILLHLHQATVQKATEEMQHIAAYQQKLDDKSSIFAGFKTSANATKPAEVMPWELGFYQQYATADLQQQSPAKHRSDASISSYLPLNACVDGLQYLSQHLFNLIMQEVPLETHETWTQQSSDIRKFHVFDASHKHFLGTCYFDLYHRDGKFPGAAHFTIRCGCEAVNWNAKEEVQLHTHRQTPVVALVFHFQRPASQRSYTNSNGQFFSSSSTEPLLSLHDLESLFHEWGHALHSLLSQTKFQHLSGTRGSTDYIEVRIAFFFLFFAIYCDVFRLIIVCFHE